MPDAASHHIHLISDSTGETLHAMARACLAPFEGGPDPVKPAVHVWVFVRTRSDLETALKGLERRPGLVCFTLVDREHRLALEETCARLRVPALAVLDPLVAQLATFLGRAPVSGVGLQHRLDRAYFQRIAALDFAMESDDGAGGGGMIGTASGPAQAGRLLRADVILTGVSRTSKTPTSIYLAHRGVKAANVPIVPGQSPGEAFLAALEAGVPVIGLTVAPARLAQIRAERLEALGDRPGDYADLERVRQEVTEARLFFERHRIPVLDVTRRSIEETAAAILRRLAPPEGA